MNEIIQSLPCLSGFELPIMVFTNERDKINKKGLEDLSTHLSSIIASLNGHMQNVKRLKCVFVKNIAFKKGNVAISFVLDNAEELQEFYRLTKEGVLSKTLTEYSYIDRWQRYAKKEQNLKFHIEMDEATYNHGRDVFKLETQR